MKIRKKEGNFSAEIQNVRTFGRALPMESDGLDNGSTKIFPIAFMCSLKLQSFDLFHLTSKTKPII